MILKQDCSISICNHGATSWKRCVMQQKWPKLQPFRVSVKRFKWRAHGRSPLWKQKVVCWWGPAPNKESAGWDNILSWSIKLQMNLIPDDHGRRLSSIQVLALASITFSWCWLSGLLVTRRSSHLFITFCLNLFCMLSFCRKQWTWCWISWLKKTCRWV